MRSFATIALFFCTTALFCHAAKPPNVVFVLADDLGWTDLACQGSGYYETPHLDRLAKEGLRLMNHHHAQNCQPTRAALMTGQYAARTGIYTVGGIDRFDWSMRPLRPADNVTKLPLTKTTVAQMFQKAGYRTGMFGKWHLGNDAAYHPGQRGFEEAIESSGVHFRFKTDPPTEYPQDQYLADFLTDRAESFIRRHAKERFFLYLPHFGVHSPLQAKKEWIEHFEKKPAVRGHHHATYAAMIASVDESVGRLLKTLEELKLAENTVFIFASDNGGVGGYTREGIKNGGDTTDNAPLRSGKGSLYEGGTRVPFIIRWPGVVEASTQCSVPTIHVDLFPTLLEIAQGEAPPNQPLDGESLLPLLKDPGAAKLQREAIFQHFPGYLGAGENTWRTTPVSLIHQGDWKLMEYLEDGRLELYHLKEDLGESQNLAQKQPETAAELHAKLKAWRTAVGAPMPSPNKPRAADATPNPKSKKKGGGAGKKKKKVTSPDGASL